ncbi:MAG: M48 family metalloprotease [Chitinophagales bacterium]
MKYLKIAFLPILLLSTFLFYNSCSKDGDANFFSLQDDIALGQQLSEQIAADPATYPVLNEASYAEAYDFLGNMVNEILNSGEVLHKEDFAWSFKIIQNDTVLNAFAAPGGYIYVYTGLIKYLDDASQLAGVLGHEIAHADLRHSSERLTKAYGIEVLLNLLLGQNNESLLIDIAEQLTLLSFSRKDETESDEQSVIYLANTIYDARGAAGFFEKLSESGEGSSPGTFLHTHPDPDDRVANIHAKYEEVGSPVGGTFEAEYQAFKNDLP